MYIQFQSIYNMLLYTFHNQTLSNLLSSFAGAETLHLAYDVKYACGHYHLHASGLLLLGENEDITTHCVFHQPVPVSWHWFQPAPAICCSLGEISAPDVGEWLKKWIEPSLTKLHSCTSSDKQVASTALILFQLRRNTLTVSLAAGFDTNVRFQGLFF